MTVSNIVQSSALKLYLWYLKFCETFRYEDTLRPVLAIFTAEILREDKMKDPTENFEAKFMQNCFDYEEKSRIPQWKFNNITLTSGNYPVVDFS